MKVVVETTKGFIELTEKQSQEVLNLFKREVQRLKLMIAFDTGWTGMIISACDRKIMFYENENHIVDCSSQIVY